MAGFARIVGIISSQIMVNYVILEKTMDKFKAYHSDIFYTNEDHVLLLENGEEAQFIPGSWHKEFDSLKRYRGPGKRSCQDCPVFVPYEQLIN